MTVDAVLYPRARSASARARHGPSCSRRSAPPAAASILGEDATLRQLHATMVGIASSRFGISAHDAEDLAQSAFVTFLEVRERYAAPEEYPAILVGILRNKCFEHLRRSSSEHRKLRRYCASPDASRENPWISHATCAEAPSVLDELERREQDNEIRRSLERLSAPSGQIVSLISKRGFGRRELIAHFGVNPNTFDTRLRSCRCELRVLLAKSGIAS